MLRTMLTTLRLLLFVLTLTEANNTMLHIPVSIHPVVQECITLSPTMKFFYEPDVEFYSKLTVQDAARNEDKDLSKIVKYKIGVLFLIAASSHVSGSLTSDNLIYPNSDSKWSYQIPVQKIIHQFNGTISTLDEKIPIYKLQEHAMDVLEKRYGHSTSDLLRKVDLTPMEFYAADKKQWIKVVGLITEHVIKEKSAILDLTSCYLAELINKTEKEMKAFTLNEVDMHLYNISFLMEKLPHYQNKTVADFYRTFNLTPSQLAKMSNTSEETLNRKGLRSLIQHFKTTVLKIFNLVPPHHQTGAMTDVPCREEWDLFRKKAIGSAFENEAKNMSLSSKTLAALTRLSLKDIEAYSLNKMVEMLETVIQPIKKDKKLIERFTLPMFKRKFVLKRLNINKHNAISLIKRVTKLSKRHLKFLFGWTWHDFHFARLFSVADIVRQCTLDVSKHSLLSIAKINIGKTAAGINCRSFGTLRMIWGHASLVDLENVVNLNTSVPLDLPIAFAISQLTNTSSMLTNRVISNTRIIRWALTKITLNKISTMTNYTTDYLRTLPFQRIILLLHEMHNAGRLFDTIDTGIVNYSSKIVSIPRENLTDYENSWKIEPTPFRRSTSSKISPGLTLVVAAFSVYLFILLEFANLH